MDNPLVITGMGAVTSIGIGVAEYWHNLAAAKCGITEIERIDTTSLPIHKAAEVRDFVPKDHLPTKLVMDLEPFMQYAYVAAEEAIGQSGLDTNSERVGVVMGTALSGISVIGDTQAAYSLSAKQAGPKFILKAMGNIAPAQLAISHGIKGPSLTVTTACSSGGDALMLAAMIIRSGAADAMVVMAGEAAICPTLIQSLCKTGALSKTGSSQPFDINRNGFVLGEGGGALILESAEHAAKRAAVPLADLLSCANNTDAFNPVSPDPEGSGVAKCMELALESAGLSAQQIDYVNAHGTATVLGDIAEANAIHRVFGDRPVFLSSTKGSTGHMMGAGGITEIISCIEAINRGILPPNVGFAESDPNCALNIVTMDKQKQTLTTAMSNAMGFGGQNSCAILGKHQA